MEHLLQHLDPSRIHPALVHFPIALLTASVLLDLLSLALKRDDFRKTGFHLLVLGVLSAVAAIGAGLLAAETADAPKDILKLHAGLAISSSLLFLALLVWRTVAHNNISRKLFPFYLAIGVTGAFMILAVGFWGGHMVYEEGAGVKKNLLYRNYKATPMKEADEGAALPEPDFSTGPAATSSGEKKHNHADDHGGHSH